MKVDVNVNQRMSSFPRTVINSAKHVNVKIIDTKQSNERNNQNSKDKTKT